MVDMHIGIDPGASGAMAGLLSVDNVIKNAMVVDWVDEVVMFRTLLAWKQIYDIQGVAIEKQHTMPGNSARSDTTFQQHTGAWKCLVKLAGLSSIDVSPQQWMKRRVPAKKGPRDKPSFKYVSNRYTQIRLRGPLGGIKDGRSDAICIAEYCFEHWRPTTK